MKTTKSKTITAVLAVVAIAMFATGCSSIPDPSVAEKYTEQTAQAIIDGSWRIASAIILGLVLNAMLSS